MRIPKDIILLWPDIELSIPANWVREASLDSKYVKGWGSVGPNNPGGADTHSHTSPAHTHDMSHTHAFTSSVVNVVNSNRETSGTNNMLTSSHYHTGVTGASTITNLDNASVTYSAVSSHPPYHELIYIKAQNGAVLEDDIIALWAGYDGDLATPSNWQYCNGDNSSPDLRGRYIRGAGTGNDAGATGGSLTNSHSIDHVHSVPAHSHAAVTTSAAVFSTRDYKGTGSSVATYNHVHTANFGNSTAYDTNTNSSIASQSEDVEPLHIKIGAIQKKTGGLKVKGIIGMYLGSVASIPKGWVPCNGDNGTPDMQDYHIKIAADSSEFGNTDGSNTHTHAAQSHSHTASGHTHSVALSTHPLDTQEGGATLTGTVRSGNNHAGSTSDSTAPTISSSTTIANSANNEPPYLTAVFVQYQYPVGGGAFLQNFV